MMSEVLLSFLSFFFLIICLFICCFVDLMCLSFMVLVLVLCFALTFQMVKALPSWSLVAENGVFKQNYSNVKMGLPQC